MKHTHIITTEDVYISIAGTIGRVGTVPLELNEANLTENAARIIINDSQRLDNQYLVGFLASDLGQRQIDLRATKTSQPKLALTRIKQIPIPLPPLPEQRAIAQVLRTVQQAREATARVIEAARELKRSLMPHLFTYGPVPVGQDDQVELQETDFGSAPAHWRIMLLDECAFVQTGAAKGRKLSNASTIEVPYLRVANVQDGYLDLSEIKYIRIRESELERYGLQDGDVVLTEGGDFDKLGRGFIWRGQIPTCIHQNHIFAVRVNPAILSPEYLAYLVQSDYGKSYFLSVAHRTTNLACINKTKLSALPVLIPSHSEQKEIVRLLSTVDANIAAEESRRDALEDLFHTLLHHLMAAKIRVPEEIC